MKTRTTTAGKEFKLYLDFDTLLRTVLNDIKSVTFRWAKGEPKNEEPFLNHLTGVFTSKHRDCDVGEQSPVKVSVNYARLHRKGQNQRDRFGSDIAVTVSFTPHGASHPAIIKTAFFQLKIGENSEVELVRAQLEDAAVVPEIKERAFVLAVDRKRLKCRISSLDACLKTFGKNKTHEENTLTWNPLSLWVSDWLSGKLGPLSDPKSAKRIEVLLKKFTLQPALTRDEEAAWSETEDLIPAKVWMTYDFLEQSKPNES